MWWNTTVTPFYHLSLSFIIYIIFIIFSTLYRVHICVWFIFVCFFIQAATTPISTSSTFSTCAIIHCQMLKVQSWALLKKGFPDTGVFWDYFLAKITKPNWPKWSIWASLHKWFNLIWLAASGQTPVITSPPCPSIAWALITPVHLRISIVQFRASIRKPQRSNVTEPGVGCNVHLAIYLVT